MARTIFDNTEGQPGGPLDGKTILQAQGQDTLSLPDSSFISNSELVRSGFDLILNNANGESIVIEGYFAAMPPPLLTAPEGSVLTPALVNSFVQHSGQYAQLGSMSDESPVGAINEITGDATITRTNGMTESLTLGSPIFQGDIIETATDGSVNIVFIDETSFAISEGARLSIDEYVFDPALQSGESNFSVLRGVFVFTSGLIGRDDPDSVMIDTPIGSIGIRGTKIAGDINPGGQSQVTVLEGAIVVRNAISEVILSTPFETANATGLNVAIQNAGVLADKQLGPRFEKLKGVAPGIFSVLQDNNDNQPGDHESAPGDTVNDTDTTPNNTAPPQADTPANNGDNSGDDDQGQSETNAGSEADLVPETGPGNSHNRNPQNAKPEAGNSYEARNEHQPDFSVSPPPPAHRNTDSRTPDPDPLDINLQIEAPVPYNATTGTVLATITLANYDLSEVQLSLNNSYDGLLAINEYGEVILNGPASSLSASVLYNLGITAQLLANSSVTASDSGTFHIEPVLSSVQTALTMDILEATLEAGHTVGTVTVSTNVTNIDDLDLLLTAVDGSITNIHDWLGFGDIEYIGDQWVVEIILLQDARDMDPNVNYDFTVDASVSGVMNDTIHLDSPVLSSNLNIEPFLDAITFTPETGIDLNLLNFNLSSDTVIGHFSAETNAGSIEISLDNMPTASILGVNYPIFVIESTGDPLIWALKLNVPAAYINFSTAYDFIVNATATAAGNSIQLNNNDFSDVASPIEFEEPPPLEIDSATNTYQQSPYTGSGSVIATFEINEDFEDLEHALYVNSGNGWEEASAAFQVVKTGTSYEIRLTNGFDPQTMAYEYEFDLRLTRTGPSGDMISSQATHQTGAYFGLSLLQLTSEGQGATINGTAGSRLGSDTTHLGKIGGSEITALTYYEGGEARILLQSGGTTVGHLDFSILTDPHNVSHITISGVGDYNGDGIMDFAVTFDNPNIPSKIISGQAILNAIDGNPIVSNAHVLHNQNIEWEHAIGVGDVNASFSSDVLFIKNGEFLLVSSDNATVGVEGSVGSQLGHSAAALGDFNGNNYNDFVISAPGENSVYVVYGRPDIFSSINLSNYQHALHIQGDAGFGDYVAGLGDINASGYSDLVILDASRSHAYIIFGDDYTGAAGINVTGGLTGSNGFTLSTAPNEIISGINSVGDFNGDGYDDFAFAITGYADQGDGNYYIYTSIFVMYGGLDLASYVQGDSIILADLLNDPTMGYLLNYDLMSSSFSNDTEAAEYILNNVSFDFTAASDINGDGYGDIVISLAFADNNSGRAYTLYGQDMIGATYSMEGIASYNAQFNGQSIVAGDSGNKTISDNNRTDISMTGGEGNDVLNVSNLSVRGVHGGDGIDRLVMWTSGTLDFTALGKSISGIEQFQFNHITDQTLILSLDDLFGLLQDSDLIIDNQATLVFNSTTDSNNVIRINDNREAMDIFTSQQAVTHEGENYTSYSVGGYQLLIGDGVEFQTSYVP